MSFEQIMCSRCVLYHPFIVLTMREDGQIVSTVWFDCMSVWGMSIYRSGKGYEIRDNFSALVVRKKVGWFLKLYWLKTVVLWNKILDKVTIARNI